MNPLSIIAVAALIGYYIFKETPEEKAARERVAAEYEQTRVQEEIEEKRREAELRERAKPFASAEECFRREYVSYARISAYCSCPRRFKLVYLDKMRGYDTGFRYRRKGVALHTALEEYLKPYIGATISGLDTQQILRGAYRFGYLEYSKSWWSEERRERVKARRKTFREDIRFVCATLPTPVEVVGVEHELRFQVDGLNFFGIVDLVLKYPDGHFEIVDYKTGMRRPIKEQLEIYSIPFCKMSDGPSVSFRVICVDRKSHYLWTQGTHDSVEATARILSIVKTIINDRTYLPLIGPHCRDCSVNHACDQSRRHASTRSKKTDPVGPALTRLSSAYEWKGGTIPPRVGARPRVPKVGGARKGSGSSFSLSRASQQYRCLSTGKVIKKNEYHFVDHKGKRYCVDAFCEIYPGRAATLLRGMKGPSHLDRHPSSQVGPARSYNGSSFSLSKASRQYRCLSTGRAIDKGEYHFVDHKGRRYCADAFQKMYPDRAMSLMKEKGQLFIPRLSLSHRNAQMRQR